MSMPDKWEYPWFAAWDLGFHCVALAHVDPAFAKYQLLLLCREWFQHPNGALPAYEWDFGDVNPPVQAWAALEVFAIDGGRDLDFLEPGVRQAARQLHVVGEPRGRRRLQPVRGRLPRPRQHRPDRPLAPAGRRHARAVRRHRLDGVLRAGDGDASPRSSTAPASGRPTDLVLKFLEHFAAIRRGDGARRACGTTTTASTTTSWSRPTAPTVPVKVRSMVGHHPAARRGRRRRADRSIGPRRSARAVRPTARASSAAATGWPSRACVRGEPGRPAPAARRRRRRPPADGSSRSCSTTTEFLSPYGLRAVSAYHREHPYELDVEGIRATIDYEPAESTTVDVRRQLELAGADLVPAQLPRDQRPRALLPVLRRRPQDRVPDRQRHARSRWTRSPPTCASG